MKQFYNNILPVYKTFMIEQNVANVPNGLKNIAGKVINRVGWKTRLNGYENTFKIENTDANNKIMVGLSAGLDSVYLLTKLIEQGYEVTACHIKGLNKMSSIQEYKQAKAIAKLLGVKFITIELNSPKQAFADNPFKNQMILSLMLDQGVKVGCYRYALGSDWTTPLSEGVVGFSITDTIEVNKEFWDDVKTHWQQAELIFIDDKVKKAQRIEHLYKNYLEVFKNISSCIAPNRFKIYWKENNENKYHIELYNNRCGNCYKCCMEYLILCELGLVDINKGYYEHCWHILGSSTNSHRPDLFAGNLPLDIKKRNLLEYGS